MLWCTWCLIQRLVARVRGYLWQRRQRAALAKASLSLQWENHAQGDVRDTRALSYLAAVCSLGVLLYLLFGCVGCGAGDPLPPPDPAAQADAGTADATPPAPQCIPLGVGTEFFARARAGDPVQLLQNVSCDRVCINTAGGQSCGKDGQLVLCGECEAP